MPGATSTCHLQTYLKTYLQTCLQTYLQPCLQTYLQTCLQTFRMLGQVFLKCGEDWAGGQGSGLLDWSGNTQGPNHLCGRDFRVELQTLRMVRERTAFARLVSTHTAGGGVAKDLQRRSPGGFTYMWIYMFDASAKNDMDGPNAVKRGMWVRWRVLAAQGQHRSNICHLMHCGKVTRCARFGVRPAVPVTQYGPPTVNTRCA